MVTGTLAIFGQRRSAGSTPSLDRRRAPSHRERRPQPGTRAAGAGAPADAVSGEAIAAGSLPAPARGAMTTRGTWMRGVAIALAATVLFPAAAIAGIDITLSESGTTTVLTYSGSINTTGLTPIGPVGTTDSMTPNGGLVQRASSTQYFLTGATAGSQTFGTGGAVTAATASGAPVYINFSAPAILGLPVGYVSTSSISGAMTFPGTFTTLGITANITRTFSWGVGGAGRTVTLTTVSAPSGVPEIDPAGMGTVLALVAGTLAWLERRRLAA
jgi:hypothetical protein